MTRIKGGPKARYRHKKILKAARGYRGARHRQYRRAHEAVIHAGAYAFAGRRKKKGQIRRLWIQKISAALSPYDLSYSRFFHLLKEKHINLSRKILAELVLNDPSTFERVVRETQKSP